MPVSTRHNSSGSVERAREDDLPLVENRDENPQPGPPPQVTPVGSSRRAGQPTTLIGRMRASLGGVGASEGSDEEDGHAAGEPTAFSGIQQTELKNMLAANNQELLVAMQAMLTSTKASESAEDATPARANIASPATTCWPVQVSCHEQIGGIHRTRR